MGRYTDWDRVVRRYADFGKGNGAQEDAPEFIAPAEDQVDADLASAYAVPFCNTPSLAPGVVADLATDLAYWKKIGIRSKNGKAIKDYYDQRVEAILLGKTLVVTSGGTVVPMLSMGGGWSSTEGYGSSFGMDDPTAWVTNSAWQQASEDARGV